MCVVVAMQMLEKTVVFSGRGVIFVFGEHNKLKINMLQYRVLN